jgi:hypothetical protein
MAHAKDQFTKAEGTGELYSKVVDEEIKKGASFQ